MMFKGSLTALVTPFSSGKIDEKALERLVKFQLENETDGIVACGTTGEAATMSEDEKSWVLDIILENVKSKIPVIMGTGTNNTSYTIKETKRAKEHGADGSLVVTPYYNKPTQRGLVMHYKEIAAAVDIPIILYNVPGRTSVNMLPESVYELKDIANIVAIKEASGSLDQVIEIIRLCGNSINVLSGDDGIVLPILSIGGKGVISTTSNVIPKEFSKICSEFEKGNIKEAAKLQIHVFPIYKAMFVESNPIPVKAALALMGLISDELRLPLSPLSEQNRAKLKIILKEYNLISG
jgi:4-hydroxy-tetrahydrodipicolinate synthase